MTTQGDTSINQSKKPSINFIKIVKWFFFIGITCLIFGGIFITLAFVYYTHDIPRLSKIDDYQPKTVTDVYDRNGRIFTRFFEERRTPKPLKDMPLFLLKAVIAAEDANFYRHKGIDYYHIVRAAAVNMLSVSLRQGASTITQQVVKTFLLYPEKTFARKIKEMILAKRLEQNLSKDEILSLYLNQIYLGHGNYGVAEAAHYYFGKDLSDLSLAECAMIAALPQAPESLSPYRNFQRLKNRQLYVLNEMVKNDFITKEQFEKAKKAPLRIVFHHGEETSRDYYAEYIRQFLISRFGYDAVMRQGLKVYASVDGAMQSDAIAALENGLRDVDRRQGYHGPVARLDATSSDKLAKAMKEKAATAKTASERRAQVLGCDDPSAGLKMAVVFKDGVADQKNPKIAANSIDTSPLKKGGYYAGLVMSVSRDGMVVLSGAVESPIPFDTFKWARKYSPDKGTKAPGSPADVFKAGDVIQIRAVDPRNLKAAAMKTKGKTKAKAAQTTAVQYFELDQEPKVEGAIVAIEPESRDVLAMVGGLDFSKSQFNRVLQAKRQPGSAFKPVVYSLAIASKKFTPLTLVNDSPFVYRDAWTGKEWKPENFESDSFDGLITLREAFLRSKNLVSARLVESLGVDAVLDQAKKLGIVSDLPKFISISLGAGEVTVLELANAYSTIADNGKRAEPVFIRSVRDPDGELIFSVEQKIEQAIDPAASFVVVDMMRGVVEHGTGMRAKALGRPAAGKTGTTNESRDAWFGGFVPGLLAMVYVGFDDHASLGSWEQGSRTAVPIWTDFMSNALKGSPVAHFNPPAGVVFLKVEGGKVGGAQGQAPYTDFQAFIAGTENQADGAKGSDVLLREDRPAAGK